MDEVIDEAVGEEVILVNVVMSTGDDESTQDSQGDEDVVRTPAPSVNNDDVRESKYDRVSGENDRRGTKCVIENERCITHNCGTRMIKVSAKKWVKNRKTGLFGTKTIKETKMICIDRNGGLETNSCVDSDVTRRGADNELLKGGQNNKSEQFSVSSERQIRKGESS